MYIYNRSNIVFLPYEAWKLSTLMSVELILRGGLVSFDVVGKISCCRLDNRFENLTRLLENDATS